MLKISRLLPLLVLALSSAYGQINTLSQTTLSSAALRTDKVLSVASATGINAPGGTVPASELYVISPGNPRGEVMNVTAISGTTISVSRGKQGAVTDIPSGATVLFGAPNWFRDYDPSGGCTAASTYITPHVNTKTGAEWLCSTVTLSWVPGWNNDIASPAPTAAVASAAGTITPSGQLFHVTGTSAITGFTLPVGFVSGSFTVIPDGAFTTTNAGNIAIASTAVVGKPLTFTYDPGTAKFYPSY